jgi:2-oxo-4-hydroxy-4-carboxy-5-ureidoimidazoline decarboxylase
MKLDELNSLDETDFVNLLGGLFEHSPWVAEQVWPKRPFGSWRELHTHMVQVVRQAPREKQLALLRAHPELAGKEAQAGTLTGSSTQEQASVGLTALTRDEMAQIARFNREYLARFGFPFIVAVRNHTREGIFRELERRLANDPESEFVMALEQVYAIAQIRLEALLDAA